MMDFLGEIDKHKFDDLFPLEDQVLGWDRFLSSILGHGVYTLGSYLITFWMITFVTTVCLLSAKSTFSTIRRWRRRWRRRVWFRPPHDGAEMSNSEAIEDVLGDSYASRRGPVSQRARQREAAQGAQSVRAASQETRRADQVDEFERIARRARGAEERVGGQRPRVSEDARQSSGERNEEGVQTREAADGTGLLEHQLRKPRGSQHRRLLRESRGLRRQERARAVRSRRDRGQRSPAYLRDRERGTRLDALLARG
ncbi:hypothetical protein THAOC_25147, partial [Thalassiosira oceanica]